MTARSTAEREVQPILVGMDHSPSGMAALRWAACQARLEGRPLRIIHAWEPDPDELSSLTPAQHAHMRTAVTAACTEWIQGGLGGIGEDLEIEIDVVEGPAGPILVELAKESSLLVVGCREHSGHRRLTAQSTGLYCLSFAACPVVTVPCTTRW